MALHKRTNKTIRPFKSNQGLKISNKLIYTHKIGLHVSDTLSLHKKLVFNFKCVCQHLPMGLLRALERSWKLKLQSKCYQIVAQCLRNKSRPWYPKSDGGCPRYLTKIMTGWVFYLVKSLTNYICLHFMQHHLADYFCISQKGRWSIGKTI